MDGVRGDECVVAIALVMVEGVLHMLHKLEMEKFDNISQTNAICKMKMKRTPKNLYIISNSK